VAGILYIVATPIGNLEDITLRALRILREVDLVAAEDTRRTAKLLNHYEITTRITSYHEHNERRKLPALLARLAEGAQIALVSDAGTPGISDPGTRLVRAALEAGHRVQPVPGPSAVLAALVASGFPLEEFTFVGFPPSRPAERRRWLERLAREPRTWVLFETPHRIVGTLLDMLSVLGDRPICLARELTKVHEEIFRGSISLAIDRIKRPRGEYTLVVAPSQQPAEKEAVSGLNAGEAVTGSKTREQLLAELGRITDNMGDATRRDALRKIARRYGLKVNELYDLLTVRPH
jgi:16S rRNA (cytidine1402-2'-O)-methyltransferase